MAAVLSACASGFGVEKSGLAVALGLLTMMWLATEPEVLDGSETPVRNRIDVVELEPVLPSASRLGADGSIEGGRRAEEEGGA